MATKDTFRFPYMAIVVGAVVLVLSSLSQVSALESDLYLNASASASGEQQEEQDGKTSSQMKLGASSSASFTGDLDRSSKRDVDDQSTEVSEKRSVGSSSWNNMWSYFGADVNASEEVPAGFWKDLLNFLGTYVSIVATSSPTASVTGSVGTGTLTNLHVEKVSTKHATINWAPSVFQNVRVYYSTTTPVVATDATAHLAPWKFWKRSEVTLKGLTPNTTYFYKVVAETDSGTTTTTEASFRTTEK